MTWGSQNKPSAVSPSITYLIFLQFEPFLFQVLLEHRPGLLGVSQFLRLPLGAPGQDVVNPLLSVLEKHVTALQRYKLAVTHPYEIAMKEIFFEWPRKKCDQEQLPTYGRYINEVTLTSHINLKFTLLC